MKLYGIANCDSCRRARRWLRERDSDCTFHDLRRDGVDRADIDRWAERVGADTLLNRRGRSWRELPAETRAALAGDEAIRELLAANPLLIRRPLLELDEDEVLVGHDPDLWARRLHR